MDDDLRRRSCVGSWSALPHFQSCWWEGVVLAATSLTEGFGIVLHESRRLLISLERPLHQQPQFISYSTERVDPRELLLCRFMHGGVVKLRRGCPVWQAGDLNELTAASNKLEKVRSAHNRPGHGVGLVRLAKVVCLDAIDSKLVYVK